AGDDAADEVQKLAGRVRIERRCGLVENDEVQRVVSHGEGAGNLHHLALGERQVADDLGGAYAVARKNLVKFLEDQIAGPPTPAKACQRRVIDAGVLRYGQVWTERQLLEHAPDAKLLRERNGV